MPAIICAVALLFSGCGGEDPEGQAMESAPISFSYSGQNVTKGQALFKIDDRQYQSEVLQAQATLEGKRNR